MNAQVLYYNGPMWRTYGRSKADNEYVHFFFCVKGTFVSIWPFYCLTEFAVLYGSARQ